LQQSERTDQYSEEDFEESIGIS